MAVKNKVLRETAPLLEETYGRELRDRVLTLAAEKLEALCRAHPEENRATRARTEGDAYPAIGLYIGLQQAGIPKEEALAFLDRSYRLRAEHSIAPLRRLLKLPGLYRLYPAMFRSVARSQFGEAAGFCAVYYDTEKTRVKFDMTRCLYCDVCRREGCPELVPCFCHTDDVNNGNLHPRLCWHRTRIMGDGGDLCDFDLYVKK